MNQEQNVFLLRDYIFKRLVGMINGTGWYISFKNFRKISRGELHKVKNDIIAVIDPEDVEKNFYLDAKYLKGNLEGAVKDLIHEFAHVVFGELLADEVWVAIKWHPCWSRKKYKNAMEDWEESEIEEFQEIFSASLTDKQTRILELLIEDARKRFLKEKSKRQ